MLMNKMYKSSLNEVKQTFTCVEKVEYLLRKN